MPCNASYARFIFGKFFTSTIILYALLFAQIFFYSLQKVGVTTRYYYFIVAPLCAASFSTTRAPLSTECVAETYSMRGCPCFGLDSVGRCWRYYFISSKAFYCSSPHSTFVEPLNMLKKGRLLFASFAMNLFRTAIQPVNFCTSFLVCGGCI
jgi:hypothetical protein